MHFMLLLSSPNIEQRPRSRYRVRERPSKTAYRQEIYNQAPEKLYRIMLLQRWLPIWQQRDHRPTLVFESQIGMLCKR